MWWFFVGRALNSDWSTNSFIMVVYEIFLKCNQNFLSKVQKRKHFSRMHSTPLETIRASVTTTSSHSDEGSQMNKFEQVSSDDHQMSPAGGLPDLMSGAGAGGSQV